MKRHAKAASAGTTSSRGNGLGSIRRAFATRGFSGDDKGSGAPSSRLYLVLFGAIAVLLVLGVGLASAVSYGPGTPASFCSGIGAAAGECDEIRGVATDTSNGNVYFVDQGNNRVDQFQADGTFLRAFGAGVADGTTAAAQVCTTTCFKGLTTAGIAGGFGTGSRGIAVDPETHVVYVATASARIAYYSGGTGAFIGQTEGNANQAGNPTPPNINAGAPEVLVSSTGVAVDISDPLQHYLYVAGRPGGSSKINKFKISASGITAGSYVCQITGTATDTSVNHSECGGSGLASHKDGAFEGLEIANQPGGNLAIDANGNLFFSESTVRNIVSQFDKNGNYVTQFKPIVTGHPGEPRPEAVATLSNGNLLVADDGPVAGGGGSVVQEFNPATISPAVPPAIATAAPISEFGSGTIGNASGGSIGLATFGGDVFVGDKVNKKVWKFNTPPTVPSATTEAATQLTKSRATLHGRVNPNFASVTDCHFEYGTTTSYGSTAPCVPALGSSLSPAMVSASLSGLTLGTTYHFRLVATNSVGTTNGNDLEFTTTLVNKPEVTTSAGATEISQHTAKVAGTVNPNEVAVTDCHVNYGTTVAYGSTAPCTPNPGSGPSPVNVTASLSGLASNTTYHFQVVATNADGTSQGQDREFKTPFDPPSLSLPNAAEVGQVVAKITGTVNPNGGNVTDCHIDYGTTIAYGSQKACVPSPGSGSNPVDISASLTGLAPSTLYHFRLVATNSSGSTNSVDQTFTTLPPNLLFTATDGASAGLTATFTLEGRVDPEGLAVLDCHFAYGTTNAYGKTTPCVPSAAGLGISNSEVAVTASTEALEPSTVYHFRLIASSLRGTSQGKDRTFTTGPAPADPCPNADIRAEQGVEVTMLPDCMALEQVSPSVKGNQHARLANGGVSADGERVVFNSPAALGGGPGRNGLLGSMYIATRGKSGWTFEPQSPPFEITGSTGSSFTPDFSHWLWPADDRFYQQGLGGFLQQLTPALTNLGADFPSPLLQGASADQSHVYFLSQGGGYFLPDDPIPAGTIKDRNVYVSQLDPFGDPALELLARDRDGKAWGGNCGARLGGMSPLNGSNLNLPNGQRNQGAISPDGSRVYLSTRPGQPASGDCNTTNKERIMVREETPTGPTIEELFASECDRVSPACSATDGDDIYQGASLDQSKVYFTTNRQLADTDLDGSSSPCVGSESPSGFSPVAGCDLYLYDADKPSGERLTQVSAGDNTDATPGAGANVINGVTGISADGSRVYFVAAGVLTTAPGPKGNTATAGKPNLYTWDAVSEETAFIGTLATGPANFENDGGFGGSSLWNADGNWSSSSYPTPIKGTDGQGNEIGGDGHVLLFRSKAPLTADDTDTVLDIFRYDAGTSTLERVSKAGPGGSDNGAISVEEGGGGSIGTDYAEKGRWVSEDGETVVFATREALLPGDVNGVEDAYMWRHGELYRLPGSTRFTTTLRPNQPSLSHDGSEVAYHTSVQLLPTDGDTVQDVYVARIDGGFQTPVRPVCQGEACQGAPSTLSGEIGATSGSLVSPGNVKSQGATATKRCRKGQRKVRRKGKARCIAKHTDSKRTSRKQGGQK